MGEVQYPRQDLVLQADPSVCVVAAWFILYYKDPLDQVYEPIS